MATTGTKDSEIMLNVYRDAVRRALGFLSATDSSCIPCAKLVLERAKQIDEAHNDSNIR